MLGQAEVLLAQVVPAVLLPVEVVAFPPAFAEQTAVRSDLAVQTVEQACPSQP